MKLALTLYDDGGCAEITSVECDNLFKGCCDLWAYLDQALIAIEADIIIGGEEKVSSSAKYDKPVWDILFAIGQMGKSKGQPVAISC